MSEWWADYAFSIQYKP